MKLEDKQNECTFEAPVLAALATATLIGSLRSHVESCAICSETVAIWSYLNTVAAAEAESPLPSTTLIWWKAQLAQQRRLAAQSISVIQLFQKIAVAGAVLALSIAAIWSERFVPRMVPTLYLWAVLCLIGFSLLTAASFLYSERHTTRH